MAEDNSNISKLIGTGIGLGIVHVLTGPDHLSALATLSAVSDICTSFAMGVRWGCGHSTGLLSVGILLIIHDIHNTKGQEDEDETTKTVDVPDWLGQLCETLVGFFMLGLGLWGFVRAFKQRRQQIYEGRIPISSPSDDENEEENDQLKSPNNGDLGVENDSKENSPRTKNIVSRHHHHHHHSIFGSTTTYHDDPLESLSDIVSDEPTTTTTTLELEPVGESSSRRDNGTAFCNISKNIESILNYSRRLSAQSLAIFAGIIHGLAGPGGVLGVVPAIQLHSWKLATVYLGCFCIASTITMGCFAALYGWFSSTIGSKTNLEFHIHCFSSALSILVGITWLTLLSMGILDDVFP